MRKCVTPVLVVLLSVLIVAPAMAQDDNKCVLEPAGICTDDVNVCGFSSFCECPAGYFYSPAMGKCLLGLSLVAPPAGSARADDDVACALEPSGICTDDVNICGFSSICECPDSYFYSPAVGKCLLRL